MIDSREKGKPLPFGPKARSSLAGFRVSIEGEMEEVVNLQFYVDTHTLWRWMSPLGYKRYICPHCGEEMVDEDTLIMLRAEEHIHMSHGPSLPSDHPLSRRTRMQKLIDWLETDP